MNTKFERDLPIDDQARDIVSLHLPRTDYVILRGVLSIRLLEARQGSRAKRFNVPEESTLERIRLELAREADILQRILEFLESQVK